MKNKFICGFCGGVLVVLLGALASQEIFADQDHVAANQLGFLICTPPKREVCGPVHPGPGPIICRCV